MADHWGAAPTVTVGKKNQNGWKYPGLGLRWEEVLLDIAKVCKERKL